MIRNQSFIKHMHLHDAKGQDDHLELYSGEIDLPEKIEIAQNNKSSILLEVKTKQALIQSVAHLKEKHIFK